VFMVSEEQLGVRIRRLRVARGMTQAELAAAMRALGVRAEGHTISHYESDVYEPKLRAFAVLARSLGVTMEALLYGEEAAARIADERERAGGGAASAGG
jgi:transcriptional regulator with XRE-family HTH domain